MNRQWMYIGDRRKPEYITGLRNFLIVAQANCHNGFMCCPCVDCQNKKDYRLCAFLNPEAMCIPQCNISEGTQSGDTAKITV